jgi:hypothetical protein
MREQLRLGYSGGGKLIAQNLTRAAVQSPGDGSSASSHKPHPE